jgi:hypothetical protein
MQFSKIALFLPLLSFAAAIPVAEAEAAPEISVRAPEMLKRGFGCPFNRYECNAHVCCLQSLGSILSWLTQILVHLSQGRADWRILCRLFPHVSSLRDSL